jgi:hypothetical protein
MEPIGSKTKFNAFIIAKGDVIYSPGDITNMTNTLTMYTYNEQNKKYKDKIP